MINVEEKLRFTDLGLALRKIKPCGIIRQVGQSKSITNENEPTNETKSTIDQKESVCVRNLSSNDLTENEKAYQI